MVSIERNALVIEDERTVRALRWVGLARSEVNTRNQSRCVLVLDGWAYATDGRRAHAANVDGGGLGGDGDVGGVPVDGLFELEFVSRPTFMVYEDGTDKVLFDQVHAMLVESDPSKFPNVEGVRPIGDDVVSWTPMWPEPRASSAGVLMRETGRFVDPGLLADAMSFEPVFAYGPTDIIGVPKSPHHPLELRYVDRTEPEERLDAFALLMPIRLTDTPGWPRSNDV